jgi:polyribonucleotide nucleotidyltransferase
MASPIINPFGGKHCIVETEFCGRKLQVETGHMAFQADGAVTVRYGDTLVLATAVVSNTVREGIDFFPLLIDYEERMYASGKISGSRFIKREGRASDQATLAARLIDRPIRPLFPKGYRNDIQAIATVLSADRIYSPDIISIIAISTALMLTGAPFAGPVAGVRVGLVEDKLVLFPTFEQTVNSKLDLVVAGTNEAIMMVEAGANEVSKEKMIEAIKLAHQSFQPVIELQNKLVKSLGVKPKEYDLELVDTDLRQRIETYLQEKLGPAIRHESHYERHNTLKTLKEETLEHFAKEHEEYSKNEVDMAFEEAIKAEVRRAINEEDARPDNRKKTEIRPLSSIVGLLPRAHGSSLFTRGSTQALNITTLASTSYGQLIDTMGEDSTKHFMHHYNFTPYSTGEVRPLRGPGRREIGHGALAERAIEPMIPNIEEFPYTIRTVSEILSSNGSTSMASVCSATLSLMDAGVPIKKPVAGIAMGLIKTQENYVILSDIAGAEDFAGDMDFKVAGTKDGITALQMDIKIPGITPAVMERALVQAEDGLKTIMAHLMSVLGEPRAQLSSYAPRISKVKINPDKIREIIGKGGETINKIVAESGAEIDIKDDGLIFISSISAEGAEKAIAAIKAIATEPEIGTIYEGMVTRVMDFGAFVEILPGKEGMVHISELAESRVNAVRDVVKEGDKILVKLIGIDDRGRLNLSKKAAMSESGKDKD